MVRGGITAGVVPFAVSISRATRRVPLDPDTILREEVTGKVLTPMGVVRVALREYIFPDPSGTPAIVDSARVGTSLDPAVVEWSATVSVTITS